MFGIDPETMLRTGLAMVDTDNEEQLNSLADAIRALALSDEERAKIITLARTTLEALGATTQ